VGGTILFCEAPSIAILSLMGEAAFVSTGISIG